MPDIRIRPGQLNPSDIGVAKGERPTQDIVLRRTAGSDVAVAKATRPVALVAAGGDSETHSGTGAFTVMATFAQAGKRAGLGTGANVNAASFTQAGKKAGQGTTTYTAAVAFARAGKKSGRGDGTATGSPTFVRTGRKADGGVGSLVSILYMEASSQVIVVPVADENRSGPWMPHGAARVIGERGWGWEVTPIIRTGTAEIPVVYQMGASGVGYNDDDEAILLLMAA